MMQLFGRARSFVAGTFHGEPSPRRDNEVYGMSDMLNDFHGNSGFFLAGS